MALVELTREEMSPLTLLTGGATAGAGLLALLQVSRFFLTCRRRVKACFSSTPHTSCALTLAHAI